jgi:hypothetical protein
MSPPCATDPGTTVRGMSGPARLARTRVRRPSFWCISEAGARPFVRPPTTALPERSSISICYKARYSTPVNQGDTNFLLYESAEFHSGTIFEAGLRAGYIANDGQWELSVFARNLTDEENLKGGIDFNNLTGFVNEPRIFGLSLQYNFGE